MRHLTERLMQTVFLLVEFALGQHFHASRAHWATRVRFWTEAGSSEMVRLVDRPAILTREAAAAAAAAGEPRRPI